MKIYNFNNFFEIFESKNKSIYLTESNEFYYKKINTPQEYKDIFNNLIKFSKSDYNFISKIIKTEEYKVEYRVNNIHLISDDVLGYTNIAYQIMIIGKMIAYIISKKKDDYFIIEKCGIDSLSYANRYSEYYYCDQLEGLSVFFLNEFKGEMIEEKFYYRDDRVETISEFFEMFFDLKRLNMDDFYRLDFGSYIIFVEDSTGIGDYVVKIEIKKLNNYQGKRNEEFYKKFNLFSDRMMLYYNDVLYISLREYDSTNRIEIFFRNNIVKESKYEEDTLYIFDLDDTLFLNPNFEKLAIEYLKEDISIKDLLQSSLRRISKSIKDLKWENGRIFIEDPDSLITIKGNWVRKGKRVYLTVPDKFYYTDMSLPIKTTELSELYNSVKNKAIVTGRALDIKDKIKKSLEEFNLDDPNYGLHCYPAKRGTTEKVADWKAKTIIKLIKDSKFKKAYFYDDNSKWVNKVTKEVKKELPDIEWNPIKYKHKNG